MKKLGLVAIAFALLGAKTPESSSTTDAGNDLSTQRRVAGVITAVDPAKVTIASTQRAVTGKIDPARTKVTVNGHPGKVADLQLTAHAKGELCLDDVWLTIDTR